MEELKIGSIFDYKIDNRVFTPDRFINLIEERQNQETEELLNMFYEDINKKLMIKSRIYVNGYVYWPSEEFRENLYKNDQLCKQIIEEYKKAGWYNVFIDKTSKYITFLMTNDEKINKEV